MHQRATKTTKAGMGFYRRGERDRHLFIAAAGLAFSLLVVLLLVINFRSGKTNIDAMEPQPIAAPANVGTATLLTAARPITAGTKVSDVELKEVYWPRGNVPEGAIFDRSELRDMYAKENIPTDVPISRRLLTDKPMEISIPIPPGHRAFAIEVDAEGGADNLATPGSIVDVLLTYHEQQELTTKIIVENARVLSVGGEIDRSRERARSRRGKITMNLAVVPADALKLATAVQMGRLTLAMRPLDDRKTNSVTQITRTEIGDKKAREDESCSRGTIRAGGITYRMNCDGTMTEVVE
jgi:pilus assembly protein CpaB